MIVYHYYALRSDSVIANLKQEIELRRSVFEDLRNNLYDIYKQNCEIGFWHFYNDPILGVRFFGSMTCDFPFLIRSLSGYELSNDMKENFGKLIPENTDIKPLLIYLISLLGLNLGEENQIPVGVELWNADEMWFLSVVRNHPIALELKGNPNLCEVRPSVFWAAFEKEEFDESHSV